MKQTAVQTLIAWGDKMMKEHPLKHLSFAEAIDKAEELLEMEKEQMFEFWQGGINCTEDGKSFDQYYNENYEKNKQIKCYCGHTTYCDCSPLEETKQFTTEMLIDLKQGLNNAIQKSNPLFPNFDYLNKIKNKETLEEAAERYIAEDNNNRYYNDFIEGAKWQQEKMYSEEEVEQIARFGFNAGRRFELKAVDLDFTFEKWFEQFKKHKGGEQ